MKKRSFPVAFRKAIVVACYAATKIWGLKQVELKSTAPVEVGNTDQLYWATSTNMPRISKALRFYFGTGKLVYVDLHGFQRHANDPHTIWEVERVILAEPIDGIWTHVASLSPDGEVTAFYPNFHTAYAYQPSAGLILGTTSP